MADIKLTTDRAIRRLNAKVPQIEKGLKESLERAGQDAVDLSKANHEYRNQTGRGEKSHFSLVLDPGQTQTVVFLDAKDVRMPTVLSAGKDKITLYLGAKRTYLFYVERVHGFSAVINEFIALRKKIPEHLKTRDGIIA